MSLLHRQIAERARLNPQRGGMPWQVVTEPLTLLVSAVAGEMGSDPLPLKANVGAIFFFTHAELVERGRPTNNGIGELDRDLRRQFVYVDPVKARQAAKDLRETASHMPGSPVVSQFLELANKLDNDADICEARMKSRPASEFEKQIAFYSDFNDFKNQWDTFYGTLLDTKGFGDKGLPGSETGKPIAEAIDAYDAEYRRFVEGFGKLGGVLTTPAPPKSEVGDTKFPDIGKAIADTTTGILKPIIYGGLIVGAGLLAVSMYRPGPSQPSRAR